MAANPMPTTMSGTNLPDTVIQRLRGPGPVVAFTGAGVSAESGLATFRGPGGIWEGRSPMELATPEAFAADPALVWRFYAWRRSSAAAAEPNPAHRALAALARARADFTLITQNVDGLHERAGNTELIRLHGSLWRNRCTREGTEAEDRRDDLGELPPHCSCGGMLRPGVVWFGESLPVDALERAAHAAREAALLIVVGTSAQVYPAADLPRLAREAGAFVVEINPEPTGLTGEVDVHISGAAGEVLPDWLRAAGIPLEEPA